MNDKTIKCIIFDLDNTIWDGIVLEDEDVCLKPEVKKLIKELDKRGVLMSIASKGETQISLKWLEQFDIKEYFLYPQINWTSKKDSILKISNLLNIGLNTIAFVDDQDYELEEVAFYLPEVLGIKSQNADKILDLPRLKLVHDTEEAKRRREFYISEINYNNEKTIFKDNDINFYKQLNMRLKIRCSIDKDIDRLVELTDRTNKFNSIGSKLTKETLGGMLKNESNKMLTIIYEDKFCNYGIIGMIAIEESNKMWTINLINLSCRIMNRNIGKYIIDLVIDFARINNKILVADFISNGNNNLLKLLLKSCGFKMSNDEAQGDLRKMICDNQYKTSKLEYVETILDI